MEFARFARRFLGVKPKDTLIIGEGQVVVAPDGQVKDTTIVGQNNLVESTAESGAPAVISGVRAFGRGNAIRVK